MGRPKEHDEHTRAALLRAAEELVSEGGPDALSVRGVADRVGTTTRAVYSLFGSKDGLVSALAERAFDILYAGLVKAKQTDDPSADLIDVGVRVFRRFVCQHPSLYRIAFQRSVPGLRAEPQLESTRAQALALLEAKVGRVVDRSVRSATVQFNAMCEGLANAELRGATLRILPEGKEERAWREALRTVVSGFSA